jgi:ATP-dependent Lhr-like helicase
LRLPIRIETRTGDTPADRRTRQRETPDILLTTPESLALLLWLEDFTKMFAGLDTVVVEIDAWSALTNEGKKVLLFQKTTVLITRGQAS